MKLFKILPSCSISATRRAPARFVVVVLALIAAATFSGAAASAPPASASSGVALAGRSRPDGYDLQVARRASGRWTWSTLARLRSAAGSGEPWVGYECLTGDGRWAVVVTAPRSAANRAVTRDRGAVAYAVSLRTRVVRRLATGVALKYYSPGCGAHGDVALTRNLGVDQARTEVVVVRLATMQRHTISLRGQATSAVPVAGGVVVARGGAVQRVRFSGAARTLLRGRGTAFDLRATGRRGVDVLIAGRGQSTLWRIDGVGGRVRTARVGSGRIDEARLFAGARGRTVAVGLHMAIRHRAGMRVVSTSGRQVRGAALDGQALVGERATSTTARTARTAARVATSVVPTLLSARTGRQLRVARRGGRAAHVTIDPVVAMTPPDRSGRAHAAVNTTTPKCAVPRNDLNRQVPQPNAKQVRWAIEQAVRNNLKGSTLTRPANFLNMGLVSYQPSLDFAPAALSGWPSGIVPPSVLEGIFAQESNFQQASWHSLPGVAGNPLVADYYGAGGGINTIDYDQADCGYGVSQLTDPMTAAATALSANGKTKVAVDYAENVAAGLQILISKWNELWSAGVRANNGDPQQLENWYFSLWAYNTGFHANTGSGPWGLGWTNNPQNADYPPNRTAFLRSTYADAAHPGDWPYQERVIGFMETPLLDYKGRPSYGEPTRDLTLPAHSAFCTAANECSPWYVNSADPSLSYCQRADRMCWWHSASTWASCPTQCAQSIFATTTTTTEPASDATYLPQCSSDLPSGTIIIDNQPSNINVRGCGASNWTSQGTFAVTHGVNSAGVPIGVIDWHQHGTGFGGHFYFTHNRASTDTAHIEKGTWTPPSTMQAGLYSVQAHVPVNGATAEAATYQIYKGDGTVTSVTINQHINANRWVSLGVHALQPGAKVVLTNVNSATPGTVDIAYDAVALTLMQVRTATVSGLAAKFKPTIKFDTSEKWRPLNLSSFVTEKDAVSGQPLHNVCMPYTSPDAQEVLGTNIPSGSYVRSYPSGTPDGPMAASCPPVTSLADLTRFRSGDAFLDLNGYDAASDVAVYQSPDSRCRVNGLYDCNGSEIAGDPKSAIYYQVTEGSGNTYIQYWMFYRMNSAGDNTGWFWHEGDWEAVAIAPSADASTFNFASFSQHGHWYSYLRTNLRCSDQADGLCGTDAARRGTRVVDYVANGTHANYGFVCSESVPYGDCDQGDGITPDRGHDGARAWGHNTDGLGLLAAPAPDSSYSWWNWAGHWGASHSDTQASGQASPKSPAVQSMYSKPYERCTSGQSTCALPARRRSGAGLDVAQRRCDTWFGGGVTVLGCSSAALRSSVLNGRVGRRGGVDVHVVRDGRVVLRAGTAPGMAQGVGAALRVGDRVRVEGRVPRGWQLRVRVRDEGRMRVARWDVGAGDRRVTVRVMRRHGRVVLVHAR